MFKLDIKYLLIAKRSSIIKHIPGYMPSIFPPVVRCLCSKSMPTNWIDYGTEFQFSGPKDANNQTSGCAGEDGSGYRATLSCGRWKRPQNSPKYSLLMTCKRLKQFMRFSALLTARAETAKRGLMLSTQNPERVKYYPPATTGLQSRLTHPIDATHWPLFLEKLIINEPSTPRLSHWNSACISFRICDSREPL